MTKPGITDHPLITAYITAHLGADVMYVCPDMKSAHDTAARFNGLMHLHTATVKALNRTHFLIDGKYRLTFVSMLADVYRTVGGYKKLTILADPACNGLTTEWRYHQGKLK